MNETNEYTRALDDLHTGFKATLLLSDPMQLGAGIAVDRHIRLIDEYSQAVARVVEAFRGNEGEATDE